MSAGAGLAECRVLEIGAGSALAYGGKLLAAFGAEVLKIEPQGGDPMRRIEPCTDIGDGRKESAYFAWLNIGKRSSCLDDDATAALAREADVLLDGRAPGAGADGPLSHAALRAANPGLVVVATSWFGESGPYRDYLSTDATCRALAGLIHLIGPEDRPVHINDHQADIVGGLNVYVAALAGLFAGGERFEVSIHEANLAVAETHTAWGPSGPRRRLGNNRFSGTFPVGVYRCREGWLGVGVSSHAQWLAFCDLFDMRAAAANPAYALGADRSAHKDEIEPLFVDKLKARTAAEWFAIALERKLPFAIVPEMHELLAQPVFRVAGAITEVSLGSARFEAPAVPLRLPRCMPRSGGAAALLEDRIGFTPRSQTTPMTRAATAPGAPLAGLRIVDLTMGWAGPLATRTMADLGADVIKIESCGHMDWWRGQDPRPVFFQDKLYEQRPNFLCMNRNKRGITLDLTTAQGVALVKRLVAGADAVVENYAHGVVSKLGLGYEALRAVRPDLVMVSMPAFRSGPWQSARAYGFTLEQASGLPTIAGEPQGPPLLTHYAYGDPIGGLNAACALLTGLMHRNRTGEGQYIELSQVECMLPLTAYWIIAQSVVGATGPRLGNRHPEHVPQNCFRCAGEDDFVHVAVTDDAMWARLCSAIGRDDWLRDPSLATASCRRAREDELEAGIGAWSCRMSAEAAMQWLQQHRIVAGVVRSPYDLVGDPHLQARGVWQHSQRRFSGAFPHASLAVRTENGPYPVRCPAPTLGEHNEAVLGGILGLGDEELVRLGTAGVIGTEARAPHQPRKKASS